MTINVRTKGQEGEREIAKILNAIVSEVRAANGYPAIATRDELFQRNQNQSAVGGADLSNPMGLEIEIKRQEALSVNGWWKQCKASAERTGGVPVLIFRQNRKPWRVVLEGEIPVRIPGSSGHQALSNVRIEVDIDTFKNWFRVYYQKWLIES